MRTLGNLALAGDHAGLVDSTGAPIGSADFSLVRVSANLLPAPPARAPRVVQPWEKQASLGHLVVRGFGPGLIYAMSAACLDYRDPVEVGRWLNGFGITFGGDLATLVAINTALANVGNAGGLQPSTVAGTLSFFLSSAAPASPHADATSFEIGYPAYARQTAPRSSAGFTVASTNVLSNAAAVTWPACGSTGSTFTVNDWGLALASSGASHIVVFGTVTTPLIFGQGVSPLAALGGLTSAWQ